MAIARFRLIVAAVQACGIKRLKQAPGWKIHLATGDSLLFGSRWNRTGEKVQEQTWFATDEGSWAPEIYACEDKEALQEVLGQQYHAVVGNPPYIEALEEALARHGKPDIFNSDQGSQFTSVDFTGVLLKHGVAISMDGRGAWRDNVFVERLWRSVNTRRST